MPYSFPSDTFHRDNFIRDLMTHMGSDAKSPHTGALKTAMEKQLDAVILKAALSHLEPDVVDAVSREFPEAEADYLMHRIMLKSPESQLAVLAALDEFYDQSVEAARALNQ